MVREFITAEELAEDLRGAGVAPGGVLMVNARMSAFPWLVGGVEAMVRALLAVLGPEGTLCAYAGWEDNSWHLAEWSTGRQDAYRAGLPAFDPAVSEARRSHGRLAERIRTWPGARRSVHPEANLVAIGPRAGWLTAGTLDDDPHGAGSPLGRAARAGSQVLLLGSPLSTLTILHHAERIAAAEPKRWVTYEMPVLVDGKRVWRRFHEIDTSCGAYDYASVLPDGENELEAIATSALESGIGRRIVAAGTPCHLFPARALVEHAVAWIEERF